MKKVYTGGTFDLFHSGHVNFLRMCKELASGGKLVVALNTDEFVKEYKGKEPVYTYEERYMLVSSCTYVDEVVPNTDGADSKPTILRVSPDLIVIADDWARKDYYKQMNFTQEWLDKNNIILCYIPYTHKNISTTLLKERILRQ